MQQLEWFRAYVEKILAGAWEHQGPEADDDGDYPFRYGTAACHVRIEPGPPLTVRVFAQAVTDVRRTAKLLIELNEFNAAARSVTAYWNGGRVLVDEALAAEAVTPDTLVRACVDVGQAAHDMGTLVAAMYDGRTPYAHPDPVGEHRED